jgi:hypothetical protein
LLLTNAFVIDLRISFRTDTLVASGGVETFVLAVVLAGGALIQISTRDSIGIKDISFRTGADETALRVHARKLARRWCQFALVDVWNQKIIRKLTTIKMRKIR